MRQLFKSFVVAGVLVVFGVRSSYAYPVLQLDIKGGTYNQSIEEIVGPKKNVFTLYAYLTPAPNTSSTDIKNMLADTYYISAALTPQTFPPGGDFGSFNFNGTTVRATQDMVYGNPPLEGNSAIYDPGDLATHGIYNTYFKEFSFTFNKNNRSTSYATAINSGQGPTLNSQGGTYYKAFQIDMTNLSTNVQVHFDMYNESVKNGDTDVNKFAPFSHTARSAPIPEPNSMLLVGTGVVALTVRWRRRKAVERFR